MTARAPEPERARRISIVTPLLRVIAHIGEQEIPGQLKSLYTAEGQSWKA
jgi:hypothetical protein